MFVDAPRAQGSPLVRPVVADVEKHAALPKLEGGLWHS
jgi:hypothetical protein